MTLLPAGLGHARNFTAHSHLAQFVTSQTELAKHATGATGHRATVALAGGVGVTGQLLNLQASLVTFFVRLGRIVDDSLERGALGGILCRQLDTLDIAVDE
ncbi:MAG: hypothetical protein BGO71_24840 [Burkholderiales bacterium 67-32]|nr:MAG: hypothetical protein BGO71_24840 [Burkholderiales bacterium 67-32]